MGIVAVVVLVLLIVLCAVPVVQLSRLAHPARRVPTTTPAAVGLGFATAAFDNASNTATLSGWWIPAPGGTGATAILVAARGQNRLLGGLGLPLAQYLQGQGWNVLMFDLQGVGQSQPGVALAGPQQVDDVLGAVRYARYRIAQAAPIVLLGYGSGGAVALMAAEQSSEIAGVLADSPFSSLNTYLRQNLSTWTHLPPRPFQGLLLRAWPIVTGIRPAAFDPLTGMSQLGTRPVLLVAGARDAVSPVREDRALARADASSHLWVVAGAGHLQAWRTAQSAYRAHLAAWLSQLESPIA